jgi:cation diffusion facilitator family transporter
MTTVVKLAIGSIVVGLLVLALKFVAYLWTGSIALLSDALESIVNVATAIAALVAVRMAARPPDANHPYGHHKAEYFSAVLEAVMITVAAMLILREAYFGLMAPKPLEAPLEGLLINALASGINAIWCRVLLVEGKRRHSPALVADGRHLLADVVSSVGVTVGVLLAIVTGWSILDPALAILVAINILWSGWQVMRASLPGLMDEAIPEDSIAEIRNIIAQNAAGAIQAHDVRTRRAGQVTFVEFHLVMDGDTRVRDAHDTCDRIERALKDALGIAVVTIHVEPEHKAKQTGETGVAIVGDETREIT